MTSAQFKALKPGDIVRHIGAHDESYLVTANYGDRCTVVRTHDLTNPADWVLVRQAEPAPTKMTPSCSQMYRALVDGNVVHLHVLPAGYLLRSDGLWVHVSDLWRF